MIKVKTLDPNIDTSSVQFTFAPGLDDFSMPGDDIVSSLKYPNFLSFDGLGIDLNDTANKKFYQTGDYAGFVSQNLSEWDRTISFEIIISLQTGGTPGDKLSIEFYRDCCESFTVYSMGDDWIPKSSVIIEDGIAEISIEDLKIDGEISKLKLSDFKTRERNQFLKISTISIGELVIFTQFKSSEVNEEINILSDDLPYSTFNCQLINENNIELKKNRPLYVYNDEVFFGKYYISSVNRESANEYSISAKNAVGKLDDIPYNSWGDMSDDPNKYIWNTSLDYFLSKLSEYTGINIKTEEDTSQYQLTGYLDENTARFALCNVGFASGFYIDGNELDDNIILKKIPTEITSVIKPDRILGDSKLRQTEIISSAEISYNKFRLAAIKDVELKSESALVKTKFEWEDRPQCIFEYDNDEVIIYNNNLNYCIYELKRLTSLTVRTLKISFYKKIETVENDNAESDINNVKQFNNYGLSSQKITGGTPRIVDISRADDVKKYIKSKGIVSAKIILNGEKIGDLVQIETAWDGVITGIITSMIFSLGSSNIADIEVTEWQPGQN